MDNWLEWLGYLASLIVLISLLMSSIIKLRWISLIGSLLFSLYGFLIGALPVGLMNLCICFINIYFLFKIYNYKEYFKILPIKKRSLYYDYFLDFYKEEIDRFSESEFSIEESDVAFYILRNMVPAGIFMSTKLNDDTLKISLDFVVPEYRDFKIAKYVFDKNKEYFTNKGFYNLVSFSTNEQHIKYLLKMGFELDSIEGEKCYMKSL
ncbi:YgjV family protein [Vallitalea guaymasensis]|uniref:YgjV family protein n=1 Tax=Vallitalea guaymasensis TaxID=1185412 RepID=UPI00272C6AC1|nr:YgjV family protein [Vallitalea guaymasensis]